jgi:hypothetical protein
VENEQRVEHHEEMMAVPKLFKPAVLLAAA